MPYIVSDAVIICMATLLVPSSGGILSQKMIMITGLNLCWVVAIGMLKVSAET